MRKKILILAEAGEEIGMGHVVRIGHLARLFKTRGHHLDLLTNAVGHAYFKTLGINSLDVKNEAVVMQSDITIVDYMLTDDEYLQALRPHTDKLVVIVGAGHTITAMTRWVADLIIYQCPTREDLYSIVPGEQIISGLNHLILHPQYAAQDWKTREDRGNDFMMYFGGGVPPDFEEALAMALQDKGYRVGWKTKQPRWIPTLYDALRNAKFYLGTMGMAVYEAISTGSYPIVFCRSQDHMEVADHLEDMGYAYNLGRLPKISSDFEIDTHVDWILDLHKHAMGFPSVIDGKGAFRVAREILR